MFEPATSHVKGAIGAVVIRQCAVDDARDVFVFDVASLVELGDCAVVVERIEVCFERACPVSRTFEGAPGTGTPDLNSERGITALERRRPVAQSDRKVWPRYHRETPALADDWRPLAASRSS